MWGPDGPPASLENSIGPSQLEVMSSGGLPHTHIGPQFSCIQNEATGKDYLLSTQAVDYVPWAAAKTNRTQDQHLENIPAIVCTLNVSKDPRVSGLISREW